MPVPTTLFKGTTFFAEITSPQRPWPTWSSTLKLTQSGQPDIVLTGTEGDNEFKHLFTASAADTALWQSGIWNWAFIVTDGTQVFVQSTGIVEVKAINGGMSELTQAIEALADVREALAQASGKVASYSIKDRSLSNRSIQELIQLEGYWLRRVQALESSEGARGNKRITYGSFSQ